jgi:ribulose-5-phosphate 4-epimerase/fuculose-1-phosphate aldolase
MIVIDERAQPIKGFDRFVIAGKEDGRTRFIARSNGLSVWGKTAKEAVSALKYLESAHS